MKLKLTLTAIGLVGLLAVAAIDLTARTEASPSVAPTSTLPKHQGPTPRPTESHGDISESTTTAPATTTSTTTTTLPDTDCSEWWPTAQLVGWDRDQWDTLSYIIWRESRCQPDAYNPTDPNGGSYGLVQINGFWIDYLCQEWSVCHPNELYDPQINLGSAIIIYNYSVAKNGCGYHPWRVKC